MNKVDSNFQPVRINFTMPKTSGKVLRLAKSKLHPLFQLITNNHYVAIPCLTMLWAYDAVVELPIGCKHDPAHRQCGGGKSTMACPILSPDAIGGSKPACFASSRTSLQHISYLFCHRMGHIHSFPFLQRLLI